MVTATVNPAAPAQQLADLVSAFDRFTGASSAIERQHLELTRHLEQLGHDLVQANERLSVLINALPAAVLLVEHGQITHFNDAAAKLIPGLQTQTIWALPAHWEPGEGPNEYRTSPSPRARTVQLQQNHSESRVVIQIQDITDNLRNLEDNERVSRLAAMGKMSAGIAHQLRTPLSTALLYAAHLSNPALELSDRTDFSHRLQNQLLHLEKLASQMLQFIKPGLQATRQLSLDDVAQEATDQTQGLFQRHGVQVALDLQASSAMVEAESASLVAALVAVLENAAQASPAASTVRIATRVQGQRAEVVIEDQGPGISAEMLDNLFEPFATDRSTGTGLGLSIASNVIRRHRGDIAAHNRPEGGACFTIALPCLAHF
jgi:two-component system, sensor histidine kinase FlrB